jgi:hypothetical protein
MSRNCLVNGQRSVKLADFGMSRPVQDSLYYKFSRKGAALHCTAQWESAGL